MIPNPPQNPEPAVADTPLAKAIWYWASEARAVCAGECKTIEVRRRRLERRKAAIQAEADAIRAARAQPG